MKQRSLWKTYGLLLCMLTGIVSGCVLGAVWPGATILAPLGQIFMNLMFCIVVPLVFASISSAVANMQSRRRAGKLLSTTVVTFVIGSAIAAIIMVFIMKVIPPVLKPWDNIPAGTIDEQKTAGQLIVSFFTTEDFVGLLSRKAMLPLIVFSFLFGFGVNLNGGRDSLMGKFLEEFSNCMMKLVKLVNYYAPIAFFGFFANLVATYGPQITENYVRAMVVYYPLCFLYLFTMYPLYAFLGGGATGVKQLLGHIIRPAVTALGTCSSAATIPTNMEASQDSGIPKDVSEMVLPLGATMHMEGSSIGYVLKIAFLFGVLGMPFSGIGTFIKVVAVATLASSATAGIPGGGYIGEFILCTLFFSNQMDLAYPIAIAIGNLIDPPATMVNASSSYAVSFIISRVMDGRDWLKKNLAAKKATQA